MVHMFGKVIFSVARCCSNSFLDAGSNRNTLNALCSSPALMFVMRWHAFFDAVPIAWSLESSTMHTSSISLICSSSYPERSASSVMVEEEVVVVVVVVVIAAALLFAVGSAPTNRVETSGKSVWTLEAVITTVDDILHGDWKGGPVGRWWVAA